MYHGGNENGNSFAMDIIAHLSTLVKHKIFCFQHFVSGIVNAFFG